ncbi:HutD family protein [Romboutsia sedimentorum]|uniref:HutD/Ves family protein n=1 Tax=Romboutsia sedimentorum TaxID=1368474 RepID=UPI0024DE9E72|nr:HutD family protein [Romboutsia sedimentorum]MDK2585511.1 HutD family protein [Romboutsia sedimentorum]
MAHNISVIKKKDYKVSEWSGGTTTELYIYPKESKYSELDFKWRLSSAKVDIEESEFTHLSGIDRKIMVIDGKLILDHRGKYTTELNEFDIDSFSGDWTTKSYGKATDFNLMTSKGCTGYLEYILVSESKEIKLTNREQVYKNIADVLYCVSGNISIELDSKINICEGDLFLIIRGLGDEIKEIDLFNNSNTQAKVIRSTIYF